MREMNLKNRFFRFQKLQKLIVGLAGFFCCWCSHEVYAANFGYKFEGEYIISWGGYNWTCNDTDLVVIVGGPGIGGLDAYYCKDNNTWAPTNSKGLCNWAGGYSQSGEVTPNTWGHVQESFYQKRMNEKSGEYGYTTHRLLAREEQFSAKLYSKGRDGSKQCFFRGCADYATYIDGSSPRCKRKYPLYLRSGNKYYFCGAAGTRDRYCGLLEKDEYPCPNFSDNLDIDTYGDGQDFTFMGGKWTCHETSVGPYWKPANDALLDSYIQYEKGLDTGVEEEVVSVSESTAISDGDQQKGLSTSTTGGVVTSTSTAISGDKQQKKQSTSTTGGNSDELYTIRGIIKNQDGEVLPGATVTFGTSSGTAANTDGGFILSGIPHGTGVKFNFIGCNDQTKVITANEDNLAITLDCTGLNIDTVEVTAKRLPQDTPPTTPAEPSGPADGDSCEKSGAEIAKYRGGKCVAMKCSPGFEPDGDNCAEISGPCKSLPDNATRGNREYDEGTDSVKCIITDCVDGYVVADDKLSCHEDYEALAEQAREREQSFGNKLLGAVGMGATGIGGAMLMSGLAESASDDEAERAMKAYLSTFTCKYGNESVPGGTMNVEIPGGNELIQMYAEYVALANDLKARKEALGMKPGIESEAILDSATSGLYDDVSTGKTKGAYASLARALSDPDSEDAKLWAAQREESEEKKKTGAIVAGIGAIGSLLGDVLINKIDWKAKQKKVLRDLETSVANITPPKVSCPQEATGEYAPDCDCSAIDKVYNPNTNQCEAKKLSGVVDSVKSVAQDVVEVAQDVVEEVTGATTVVREDAANLSADAMFKFGESNLLPGAVTALDEFVNGLRREKLSGCTITVVGHTDTKGRDGFNKDLSEARANSVAKYLERSDFEEVIQTVNPSGQGETECKCGLTVKSDDMNEYKYRNDKQGVCDGKAPGTPVPDETAYAPCRRVVVSLECNAGSAVDALATAAGEVTGRQ